MPSPECRITGEFYLTAAKIRDSGAAFEQMRERVKDPLALRALSQVYARPELTPQEWRDFAISVCEATAPRETT